MNLNICNYVLSEKPNFRKNELKIGFCLFVVYLYSLKCHVYDST